MNRLSDYTIGINGYLYKTVDRKLNLNGKIIDENIDENNVIRYYKDYIKYIKNENFMIYDVKKEKIYNLGKIEKDTDVRFLLIMLNFNIFNKNILKSNINEDRIYL